MRKPLFRASLRRPRGFVLFMGLIFLAMLSIVAIVMMRGTLLEQRMTTATARHEQALEVSEALRVIPEAALAQYVYQRGWPRSWGGDIPDEAFDLASLYAHRPAWLGMLRPSARTGLQRACGQLPDFFNESPCQAGTATAAAYDFALSAWEADFVLEACIGSAPAACPADQRASARISIVLDGQVPKPAQDAVQARDDAGLGSATASAGSNVFFEVRSDATVPGGGEAITIAQYKVSVPPDPAATPITPCVSIATSPTCAATPSFEAPENGEISWREINP